MLDVAHQEHTQPDRGWWSQDPSSNRMAFGMVLHKDGSGWKVSRTLIGSPAERAGVNQGDILHSIDSFELGETLSEFHELHLLIGLDQSPSHDLLFRASDSDTKREVGKASLRELLEHDYDNGGALLGACVGCRTCRPVTIGATDCSSGCPGNYCTVG